MTIRDQLMGAARRGAVRILSATDGRDILHNTPDGWEVDQPWLWWDGPAGGDGTGGPWGNPPPGADAHGFHGLAAVWYCTTLIADALAGVSWQVFRGREQIPTPHWVNDPQMLRPDERVTSAALPDARLSSFDFWFQVMVSLLWYGEAFIYVPARGAGVNGRPGPPLPPLFLLHPDAVKVHDYAYWVGNERLTFADLIVIRGFTMPGKMRGVGVLQANYPSVDFARGVRDYAGNLLGRGIPNGYLKVTTPDLTEDEANRLKARWEAAHGGPRRRIAVLNATTDFQPLVIDPQAAPFVAMSDFSARQICLAFKVPPNKLGVQSDSSTYANVESRGIELVADAYWPWARRIESAMDAEFPAGTSLKLDLDGFRRADTATRYNAHKIGLDSGFLSIDDVRRMEDLPPLDQAAIGDTISRIDPAAPPPAPEPTPEPRRVNGDRTQTWRATT